MAFGIDVNCRWIPQGIRRFLLTCTLKNRPSVGSPPGVASGLLVSAGSTAEKHRGGGNGRVLKAFAGTLIYNEGDHPFEDGVLSSGWGWSALIRGPSGNGVDVQ